MKCKMAVAAALLALLCIPCAASGGIIGMPDAVPAASLIVPFFEAGIDADANPHDTLPVVTNVMDAPVLVHYHVWDVGGSPTDIRGEFSLGSGASQSFSLRALIGGASAAAKSQLAQGAFYRGFMTFDVVTNVTTLSPKSAGYPFDTLNYLEGWIYYTRLMQGSSNGLRMIPVEASTVAGMDGFYQASDKRERIDADARYSAAQWTVVNNASLVIARVHARVFLDPSVNATSRVVIFTFPKGASCSGCGPGTVAYTRHDENGAVKEETTVALTNVVNVINVTGTDNGYVSVWNIPGGWQTYAFSINAASADFDPAFTWDAIFESYMYTNKPPVPVGSGAASAESPARKE